MAFSLQINAVRNLNFWNTIKEDGNIINHTLNDIHMSEFSKLVPSLKIQDTIFLDTLFYIKSNLENEQFVQILFSGPRNSGHWICVWYDDILLRVYDSLNLNNLNDDQKKYIYCLLSNLNDITVCYEKV